MDKRPEIDATAEEKRAANWWSLPLWALVAVMVYFLSFGPVYKAFQKTRSARMDRTIEIVYAPWIWAYADTPCHRPFGRYLHFWAPDDFDTNGDFELPMH